MEKENENNIEKKDTEIKEQKEGKVTSKLRKNPYIMTTIILIIFAFFLIIENITEEKNYIKSENEILCSVIYATPAWAVDGRIVEYGVVILNDTSIDLVGTELIPNNITFVYQDGCSACEAQIDYFKEQGTWDAYVDSGLTLNCKGLM
jgi:hypothetical protein